MSRRLNLRPLEPREKAESRHLTIEEVHEFERRHAGSPARDAAIRSTFDMSAIRYEQQLLALLGTPESIAADAFLDRFLREQREARVARRREFVHGTPDEADET